MALGPMVSAASCFSCVELEYGHVQVDEDIQLIHKVMWSKAFVPQKAAQFGRQGQCDIVMVEVSQFISNTSCNMAKSHMISWADLP